MFKILTLNKISDSGLEPIKNANFSISSEEQNPDGIILRSFAMHDYPLPPTLKAVARAGAGINNIPIQKCSEEGIVVFNTPGANATAVREMVIAGLLLSNRKIYQGINWAQSLTGDVAKLVEKGKGDFVGPELYGKKIGIIGLGAIGVLVANACVALGMEVIGVDPFMSVEAAWAISRSVRRTKDINEIYGQCDYISLHIPYNEKTKHTINESVLEKVKKGVKLINFARGEIVDNAALKKALDDGTVSTYVTDFPTEELLGNPKIITIPHLAASTPEAEENCALMASEELKNYLETGVIKNSVNFPNCDIPLADGKRICIVHRNTSNIIGPITTALAERKLNITDMLSASKGDYAYALIDVDSKEINETEITEKCLAIEGVLKVRIL
ncbi:MAG: 3-phosphoglycerate dehydrogenase [Clostridiales bacterium]|nr:3-phosphoglycerate dehydrogenase [Clostridiales bacterium]